MNLRVDLILEPERRSPSVLTAKFVSRLAVLLIPVIIALVAAMAFFSGATQRRALGEMEDKWRSLDPKKKAAEKLSIEVGKNVQVLKAIEGWPASRMNLSEQMAGLLKHVPPSIQVKSLMLGHELNQSPQGVARRVYSMRLEGKSLGADAEETIRQFETLLKTVAPFAGNVQNVTMRGDLDTAAKEKTVLFVITCDYAPKDFLP